MDELTPKQINYITLLLEVERAKTIDNILTEIRFRRRETKDIILLALLDSYVQTVVKINNILDDMRGV